MTASEVVTPADALDPPAIRNPKSAVRIIARFVARYALPLLMIVGGVLRFSFLDKPPIWYDEAATYARASGTYQQMLDALEAAGFGPLHYSADWWIKSGMPMWGRIDNVRVSAFVLGNGMGRMKPGAGKDGKIDARDLVPLHPIVKGGVWMTPFMLRLIPAICGTLMIPAMYWLAIELTRRKQIALIAAALTTFSAYLLNYSRDAKMYMDLWLFVALSVASLLWWLRTRSWTAWMCWVVASTIMLGLHMLGAIAIGIELIFVLTARRAHWKSDATIPMTMIAVVGLIFEYIARVCWRLVRKREFSWRVHWTWMLFVMRSMWQGFRFPPLAAFLLGLVLIGIGPYGYFVKFNQYVQQINEVGWHGTGVQWIPEYNRGRTGPELVRYATSAFFTSWEWPKPRDENEISARAIFWLKNGCFAMLGLAIVALVPWQKLFAMSQRARGQPTTAVESPIESSRWRTIFGVMAWIVLPVYVVYLVSISAKEFPNASPTHWLEVLCTAWRDHLWLKISLSAIALFAFYFSGRTWRRRAIQSLFFLLTIAVIWSLLRGTYWLFDSRLADNWMSNVFGRGWKGHGSIWIPRYLGVVVPALFVVAATMIARFPKYVRAGAILLFIAINFSQYTARVFAGSEPPVDHMVLDSIEWRENEKHDRSMKMYYAVQRPTIVAGLGPGTGVLGLPTSKYYWTIDTRSPSDPDDIRGYDMMNSPNFPRQQFGSMSDAIRSDLKKNPSLTKLIVWDSLRPNQSDAGDSVADALGSNWKRMSDETFHAREHWTWRNILTVRRRVYVKNPSTTTRPATAPATGAATTQSSRR